MRTVTIELYVLSVPTLRRIVKELSDTKVAFEKPDGNEHPKDQVMFEEAAKMLTKPIEALYEELARRAALWSVAQEGFKHDLPN